MVAEQNARRIGSFEIVPLDDASGPVAFRFGEVFSGGSPDEWLQARRMDPQAWGLDGSWHLRFRCFAIRRPDGRVILVDTGVGPDPAAAPWAPGPGRLPQALRETSIAVEDVDVVVLTHLHQDHVGWAVVDGTPTFPAARYLLQRDEVRHAARRSGDGGLYDTTVLPLQRAGRLEALDGLTALPSGAGDGGTTVTVVPAPGHSVGHQCVVVESPAERVVISGDVLVHAIQLVNPSVAYAYEHDRQQAARTRRELVAMAERTPTLLATAHLTEAFTPIPSRDADAASRSSEPGRGREDCGAPDGHHAEAAFRRAYREVIDRWPVPVVTRSVPTDYGLTHLLESGSNASPPVVLLPGGGATAAAWSAVAGQLSRQHRVIAVDPIGQPGLSTGGDRPVRRPADLVAWLDQVLDAVGADPAAVVGHSYGAWMALRYAMHAPSRVQRLVLVDPTDCFTRTSLRYRLRALPVFLRPSGSRLRRLLEWETEGRPLDPAWLSVAALGADLGRSRVVMPAPPPRDAIAALDLPVLVVVAGRSRAHSPERLAQRAGEVLGDAAVTTLPGATHHSLPTEDAHRLAGLVHDFLQPAA
jgi:pimeloyl-ACP methyl ester carboxylesterase/glyoxylase-like metal-dependent hydrolase (beta-lactamase superfamily II)